MWAHNDYRNATSEMNTERMTMKSWARVLLALVFGAVSACSSDGDTSASTPTPDTGVSADSSSDTGSVDTGSADTGSVDTGSVDIKVDDTGPDDAGPADTGPDDAGPADTGVDDTGVDDTGVDDTGVDDTGVDDTGVDDTGVDDTSDVPVIIADYYITVEVQESATGGILQLTEVASADFKDTIIAVFGDDDGQPGALLGQKTMLLKKQTNVNVNLSTKVTDSTGATLWVGLFNDSDGDNKYTDGEPAFQWDGADVIESVTLTYTGDEVNSITVDDQEAGNESLSIIVASADLALKPAWVVIYDDDGGTPNEIIATHRFTTANLIGKTLTLDREIVGKETLWATAYTDVNENEALDEADPQVLLITQEPLWASFEVKADCGSPKSIKVCNPDDLTKIYWTDLCDDIGEFTAPCSAGTMCTDDDGLIKCAFPPNPCGNSKSKKVCNPDDLSKVYWTDLCDNFADYAAPCTFGTQCVDDGSGGKCTYIDDGCGSPKSVKVCNPSDLTAVYWVDLCDEYADYTVPCNAGTVCAEV
ncbi:MAG: hypothetical protein ACI9OJ_003757, partial [Myxococcota bacterium]